MNFESETDVPLSAPEAALIGCVVFATTVVMCAAWCVCSMSSRRRRVSPLPPSSSSSAGDLESALVILGDPPLPLPILTPPASPRPPSPRRRSPTFRVKLQKPTLRNMSVVTHPDKCVALAVKL